MYTPLLTYPVYDLNSSEFVEIIRKILEVEFNNQITVHSKTFLPSVVKKDEYLLAPVADKEIDPAFCSVIKAKMAGTEHRFANQQNDENMYVIGVLADGLENLRKITDAAYEILNDMAVKSYLFLLKNANDDNLISNSGEFYVKNLSNEYEVTKTMNDKNIIYGYLILNAEISETPKFNEYIAIEGIDTDLKVGADEKSVKQTINF